MIPILPLDANAPVQPAFGLGCMGMSEFCCETDDQQSLAVPARAHELAVRMFDTADMYGTGECCTAEGIKGMNV